MQSQTPSPCRSRWERNGVSVRLTIPTPEFQPGGWPPSSAHQSSPRRPPPTPRIRTVNLPSSSPSCELFINTPRRSPSYFTYSHAPSANSKAGTFQVVRQLHAGSYGSAFLAKDVATEQRICLKVTKKSRALNKDRVLNALRTELTAHNIIAHCRPNSFVIDCHGVFQDDEMVFFALDHMQSDLHSHLSDDLDPNRVRRWVAQMAIGIGALHEMGIIHRDIKPENVLVDRLDNIRISDFGTAFVCREPIDAFRKYSTEVVGTKEYMAPEMIEQKPYNGAVDYWALGCTMYDMIVGDVLFKHESHLRRYESWDPVSRGKSYFHSRSKFPLGSKVEDLLSGLLHMKPDSRYSISDLRHDSYFLDRSGRNIFLEMEHRSSRHPTQSSCLLEEDLQPVTVSDVYRPTADPHAYRSTEFYLFGWINPRGLWGDNRLL